MAKKKDQVDGWKLRVIRQTTEIANLAAISEEDANLLQYNPDAPLKDEIAGRLRDLANEIDPRT